jgi:repressor LexA
MKQITKCQREILSFIENFIENNGYSPTYREIGEHFKISPKGAYDHIFALEAKGLIKTQCKKPRTMKILVKKQGGNN